MKRHLKRIPSPRTWNFPRKETVFTTRPQPGAHGFSSGLPLVIILRDVMKKAETAGEVKKLLHANEIFVDGKRRKDHRFIAGLFDVITIPNDKESYRVTLDDKGRLSIKKIDVKENTVKLCKITGKTVLKGNKTQYHLHDGRNVIFDKKANIGDTLFLTVPDNKIKEILELKENAYIFLSQGKHAGDSGVLKEIKDDRIIYVKDGKEIETAKRYVFVTGSKKPVITL